jgi:hypothetical protein
MARQYGFVDADEEFKVGEKEKMAESDGEKPAASDSEGNLHMRDEQNGGLRND